MGVGPMDFQNDNDKAEGGLMGAIFRSYFFVAPSGNFSADVLGLDGPWVHYGLTNFHSLVSGI